jgi:thiol-disulfide isomerase/thioredoxin
MKLVVVSAVWCPSCLILSKQLKKIKEDYPELEIVKYDYDFDEEIVEKYNVGEKLPVMIVLDDAGNEVRRLVGEKKDEEIREFLG